MSLVSLLENVLVEYYRSLSRLRLAYSEDILSAFYFNTNRFFRAPSVTKAFFFIAGILFASPVTRCLDFSPHVLSHFNYFMLVWQIYSVPAEFPSRIVVVSSSFPPSIGFFIL